MLDVSDTLGDGEDLEKIKNPPEELQVSLHDSYHAIIKILKSTTLTTYDVEFGCAALMDVVCVPFQEREGYLNELLYTFVEVKREREGNNYKQPYSLTT